MDEFIGFVTEVLTADVEPHCDFEAEVRFEQVDIRTDPLGEHLVVEAGSRVDGVQEWSNLAQVFVLFDQTVNQVCKNGAKY